MKTIFTFLTIMFLSSMSMFAQAKLEFEGGNIYNWNDIKHKDSPAKAVVVIKNVGDKKLIIDKVKPTCGCTTAPLEKMQLDPGESTKMNITLNLPKTAGPVTKQVIIYHASADKKQSVLYLKANVIFDIEISPKNYINFGKMEVGNDKRDTLTIKNNSKKTVKFSEINISPKDLDVNLEQDFELEPGASYKLEVLAKPHKKGYYHCKITMKTDHPDFPTLRIKGFGNVKESAIFTE